MPELAYSAHTARVSWRKASDRELLEAVQRRDDIAFVELVRRKTPPLLKLVVRFVRDTQEAQDIVQVTLLRVWEKSADFNCRYSPNTWIYRIATNLSIDYLRSRASRDRHAGPLRNHLQSVVERGRRRDLARLQKREVGQIFEELARTLSQRRRAVFVLRELEGLSSKEVGQILGCRESTVRNHLFSARKILRRELIRQYPEYAEGRSASPAKKS